MPIAGEDYFSLAITNGYLHYSYELGGGAAHLVSPTRIADGKEHVVRLERYVRASSSVTLPAINMRGIFQARKKRIHVPG